MGLELSPFMVSELSNTVYQRIELTLHIGPQRAATKA